MKARTIAHLAKIGTNILGTKEYGALMIAYGAALIYLGMNFVVSASKPQTPSRLAKNGSTTFPDETHKAR